MTGRGRIVLGGLAWLGCLQFFAVEAFVAAAAPGYSYGAGFISDLGAAGSPRHLWMNGSFVLQGVLIGLGVALAGPALGRGGLAGFGKLCLAVCAVALAGVGLAPEDSAPGPHYIAALAHIATCNLGALALGLSARRGVLRAGVAAGGVGLVAGAALLWQASGPLGLGAVERLSVYPFLLWLAANGAAFALGARPRSVVEGARRTP